MDVMLKDFREYKKNTLQGFVALEILDINLEIKDCTVHQKDGKAWIGFPGVQFTDKDGKKQWKNIIEFKDDDMKNAFRTSAVAAIKKFVETQNTRNDRPTDDDNKPPF